MLSTLLSRLFLIGAWLTGIFCVVNLSVQLSQEPFRIPLGNGYIGLGENPGYEFKAYRNDSRFVPANDTLIEYRVTDSNGRMVKSGSFRTSFLFPDIKKDLQEARAVHAGEKFTIDTSVYLIGDIDYHGKSNQIGYITRILEDSSVVLFLDTESDLYESGPQIKFPDLRSAEQYERLHGHHIKQPHKIVEEQPLVATLRIYPRDWGLRLLFTLFTLFTWGSIALLLLMLSRFFRNIVNKLYFDVKNARLLFYCGWLLMIPQITGWVIYWLFLAHINPAKFAITPASADPFQYQFTAQPETNMILVFLSLGLMAMAAVFREGHRLSRYESLTI